MGIHVGDTGTVLRFSFVDEDGAVDIGFATVLEARLRRPDASTLTVDLTITDGIGGKARYVSAAGDFNQSGVYRIQGRVVTPAGEWRSDIDTFSVEENLP